MSETSEFAAFAEAAARPLLRSAWLLTGDEGTAEDLVQTALLQAWSRWKSIAPLDSPESYVRRVMINTFFRWRRRRWLGERPTAIVPEQATGDPFAAVDLRTAVKAHLRALPPRQQAVLVLRYFDDLSIDESATVLGCTAGTVKSQAARALRKLSARPGFKELIEEVER